MKKAWRLIYFLCAVLLFVSYVKAQGQSCGSIAITYTFEDEVPTNHRDLIRNSVAGIVQNLVEILSEGRACQSGILS